VVVKNKFRGRHTLRGKSPRALDVAKIPATRQTPLNEMNPPASWILLRSFSWKEWFNKFAISFRVSHESFKYIPFLIQKTKKRTHPVVSLCVGAIHLLFAVYYYISMKESQNNCQKLGFNVLKWLTIFKRNMLESNPKDSVKSGIIRISEYRWKNQNNFVQISV